MSLLSLSSILSLLLSSLSVPSPPCPFKSPFYPYSFLSFPFFPFSSSFITYFSLFLDFPFPKLFPSFTSHHLPSLSVFPSPLLPTLLLFLLPYSPPLSLPPSISLPLFLSTLPRVPKPSVHSCRVATWGKERQVVGRGALAPGAGVGEGKKRVEMRGEVRREGR